ncbi:MAG: FeoB-associated Cys-rich membrane protein [Clostridia bacterium]|nr:FeoB-associated Cys-rich membrane protein [Clostridia bacterium]
MFEWIADNAVTLIAAAAVLICAGLAVFSLVKSKKRRGGCSSCTGDCAACGMCCSGGRKKDR